MTSEVMADAAGLVGWAWPGDELHRRAQQEWGLVVQSGGVFLVPKIVFIECLSTLQTRLCLQPSDARQVAILVGKQLRDMERFGQARLINATEAQERDGWRIFEEAKIAEMTLSDCLCVAIARRRNIASVLSPQGFYRSFELTPLLATA